MVRLNIFVLGVVNTNTYIVYDENSLDAYIVDPGDESQEVLNYINERGLRVKAVIATHGHFDHILGVDYFRDKLGAEFYMHRGDVIVARDSIEWLAKRGLKKRTPPKPDKLIEGDADLKLGSLDVKLIHTPGHTPGSICIYLCNAKILFSGDTIFYESVGRTDLPGGSDIELMKSLRKIFTSLPIETIVYPGHGSATTLKHELTANALVKLALQP
ncbi:MAG: MBL fold metallo-hydrolase [Ignisphaera sp.]|uniref:MBL fold metallo-hydrolase n=1 Tax=Ignisphaera aggregans TaxID=334771 RepID=A0A7C4JK26_9CREN